MKQTLYFTFRLLMLSWITAKRQLIHNRTASRSEWNQNYDFIIVGAGAAGCVVANRLAHNSNTTVLLLEAGGGQDALYNDIPGLSLLIPGRRPDLEWFRYIKPQKFASIIYPDGRSPHTTGKTLGGSSSHNGMLFNRGNARDYDSWQYKYGAKGWSFKQLLPYFRRFENNTDRKIVEMNPGYHGKNGPIQISTPKQPGAQLLLMQKFLNSMGFPNTDVNGANQTGVMIGQSFINEDGFRSSSSNAYIDPNPYPDNLHIVTKALVTKVLFNDLTAVGVEFAKNDRSFTVLARREVIICAGAINSPQLLMLSGVGPKEELNKFEIPVVVNLPVGKNYQNHALFTFPSPSVPLITEFDLENVYKYRSGTFAQYPVLIFNFNTKSNIDKLVPNFKIIFTPGSNGKAGIVPALFTIKSKGSVRLQSNNPYVPPLIDPNLLSDPRDYAGAIEGMTFAFFIAEHPSISQNISFITFKSYDCSSCPGLKSYQCIEGIKCVIAKITREDYHPSSTCRMADVNRNDSVVDNYLRVKNTKNLKVCDNSIMPNIPNGNTYASALMIGEKCAQIIQDFYNYN